MIRWFTIKHEVNDLYYADCPPDRVWTTDPMFGIRFGCEDAALTYIVTNLNGRHQAVEIVAPRADMLQSLSVH